MRPLGPQVWGIRSQKLSPDRERAPNSNPQPERAIPRMQAAGKEGQAGGQVRQSSVSANVRQGTEKQ